jgi:uncharacterized membrane protein YccC
LPVWARATKIVASDWMARDGLIWVHALKTAIAALLALGIAMLLELPAPPTAMTTVFVLMQPMSGMVLAKSFYRVFGTTAGMIAALVLGGLFPQQSELYIAGLTIWVSACTAAAVRYRQFQWYAFVLAGYTAALIGIPSVMAQNGLFMAALTRAAEVTIGILCSSAVSALVLPLRSSTALQHTLRARYAGFSAFAASVLGERLEKGAFETRFADLVDEIVGFEAKRGFASFEDPNMRVRSRRLARLNSEFMDVCTRLHALHQLLKRLHAGQARPVIEAASPYIRELSGLLVKQNDPMKTDELRAASAAVELGAFLAMLPHRVCETRRSLGTSTPETLLDFDTTMELVHRFVAEFLRYTQTYASLADQHHVFEQSVTKYARKTNLHFVALTFLRSAVAVGAVGAFWIATDWPSGGMAVIGAAIACALSSTSPNPEKLVAQMVVGSIFAAVVGYLVTCYGYPAIDGFPLLCVLLGPLIAGGAFLSARPGTAGYGVGFCVYFSVLAGPANVIDYQPDVLINNGLAVVAAMLVTCVVFVVIFPPQMPWRIDRVKRDLRRQMALACQGARAGLNQQFQSSTHDLMFQLRMLLKTRSDQHRDALRWMLAVLEVGQSTIDLRNEAFDAPYAEQLQPGWRASIDAVRQALAQLFETPGTDSVAHALASVDKAMGMAQSLGGLLHENRERRDRMQRILSCLHFIRTALLDRDAPFDVT